MQCPDSLRVQAFFDGEVDAVSAAEIERHTEGCAQCRALLQELERTRTALRQGVTDFRASPALRARISAALDQESIGRAPPRRASARASWRTQPFWLGAVSGLGASAVAAALLFLLLAPLLNNPLVDDLADAHMRSLMPQHLIDVVSTDKHTVKPWFAGHADVSPVVADFGDRGYRLIGGRADYIDHQRSAVVVYQHGAHVINVFSWAADGRSLPKSATRSGFRLLFWRAGDLEYCAVSDTGWDELQGLVALLANLNSSDLPK
ncbi:MAG TPA: zf-HC2 domain-containing protein [Steroidobacteraceae bacterium]|jgi:anti-sigma factor RsiW|nr:zf-HC2 domain-containing protein [Steroidobacteraceae bacterium]